MTSANVTYYVVTDIYGKCELHSQHCLCKNTIKDELQKYQPANKFTLQLNHPDEDECDSYSKVMNLQDYLDGKYRHTAWKEEDGNIDDSHYCAKHDYEHLKKDCPDCIKERYEIAKSEIKRLNEEMIAYSNKCMYYELPQTTDEDILNDLGIVLDNY